MVTGKPNKFAVYTAITAGYDTLIDPAVVSADTDYFCFTEDLSLSSDVWQLRELPVPFREPARNVRQVKILSSVFMPGYDWTLWVDGNYVLRDTIHSFIRVADKMITVFRHFKRNCIYDEGKVLLGKRRFRVQSLLIRAQMERYRSEGYSVANGLAECGVILRCAFSDVVKFENEWWKELQGSSNRDQLSFNYVAWKLDFNIGYFPGFISRRNDLRVHCGNNLGKE